MMILTSFTESSFPFKSLNGMSLCSWILLKSSILRLANIALKCKKTFIYMKKLMVYFKVNLEISTILRC